MEAPHNEVRVVSSAGNVRGVYCLLHDVLPAGVSGPAYESRRTKGKEQTSTFLYLKDGCWVIGSKLGGPSWLCSTAPVAGCDPTLIPPQPEGSSWSKCVKRIDPCVLNPGNTSLDRLEMHSQHRNLNVGLRRQGSHRCWASDTRNVWLWYCNEADVWKITEGEPGTPLAKKTYAKVPSAGDSNDPRRAAWSVSGGTIDGVSEVWWPEEPEDQSAFWRDPDFPPNNSSLGKNVAKAHDTEWILARDLDRDPTSDVLFDGISPDDLKQGELGDCWLIAAIAAVAEYPKAIEALFLDRRGELPPDGKHAVRLYDVVKDDWVTIMVDEYIPCKRRKWYELRATPLFSRPHGNEMWVLILEKAFAKLYGSYERLQGGRAVFAWQALTGCRQQRLIAKAAGKTWEEYEVDVEEQIEQRKAGDSHDLPLLRDEDSPTYTEDELWNHLIDCSLREMVMAATIDGNAPAGQKETVLTSWLVADHAYSIIQIRAIGKFHLIELRNPHGTGADWKGRWGEGDDMWEKHPDVREQVQKVSAMDGTFWMDCVDFFEQYDTVSVCPCTASKTMDRISIVSRRSQRVHPVAAFDVCNGDMSSARNGKKKSEKQVHFSDAVGSPWEPGSWNGSETSGRCSQRCTNACTLQ